MSLDEMEEEKAGVVDGLPTTPGELSGPRLMSSHESRVCWRRVCAFSHFFAIPFYAFGASPGLRPLSPPAGGPAEILPEGP